MKKSLRISTLLLIMVMLMCGCSANSKPEVQSGSQSGSQPKASAPSSSAAGKAGAGTEEDYPKNPITLVVPFSAGGSIDTLCRTLGPFMGKELDTNFVIEDMPGAGSQVGLTYLVQTAKADGYTLSEVSEPHMSFSIAVQKAPYTVDDFAFLGMIQVDPVAMIVKQESQWNTMGELIDYIKQNPGKVAIGCTQMSGPQVVMLYMQQSMDLDFTIVPYEGGGEGRAALIGDHIDAYFGFVQANYSMNDIGKCLAIGSDQRSQLWPDAPTIAEAVPDDFGFADIAVQMASYRTIAVPAAFKEQYPERFEKLAQALETVFNNTEYQAECEKTGQLEIMEWHDSAEATEMVHQSFELLSGMAHYFE